ncbi:acetyltransferase [Colwellia sp. MEBiC06753]
MKKLVIIGGGGFAKEVIWLANDCGYQVVGLLDDNESMHGQSALGVNVLGSIRDWQKYGDCEFILAIGSPRIRHLVYRKMISTGKPVFATLIHPSVIMSGHVSVDKGSIICAGCILTVEITIGQHSILNLSNTVGHETSIGNFVTIAPMAAISGNVVLADFSEVGTGASIRQGLTIAQGGMLGMGGVQTKDIPENTIFAGNPAKPLKSLPAITPLC